MTNKKTAKLVQLSLLVAIIIVLTFTPLGYLKMPALGLEITFIMIPVVIGAITMGPVAGLILGTVFGITSFLQCFGMSPFGTILMEINPFYNFVVCVVSRALMGWITGLLAKGLLKTKLPKIVSVIIVSICGPLLNTTFFMTSLCLFFYNTEYIQGFVEFFGAANPFNFVILFVGVNGLIEAGVSCVVSTAVGRALLGFKKEPKQDVPESDEEAKRETPTVG